MLKLGICLNITDDGLIFIGNGCQKLIELDLYRFEMKNSPWMVVDPVSIVRCIICDRVFVV